MHSDPEESYLRDLPEFPSIEEFPSIDHNLLHFPLRGPAQGDGAQAGARPEEEPLSPASLLIQHLASPLHFVNTHFNGHARPPSGDAGMLPVPAAAAGEEEAGRQEGGEKEAAEAQVAQRSLEALSEEIVSTAISTVVQNTLSALLRSSEASEEPALAEFLPTEIPPGALETSAQPTDATSGSAAVAAVGAPGADEDPDEADVNESGEEVPDDTLVQTEEEDFELLDQSELELADEGLDVSLDGQVVGGAPETPPSPQHQPQS